VNLLGLLRRGIWHSIEAKQLSYERFSILSYILEVLPKDMPIYRHLFVDNLSQLVLTLAKMLEFEDRRIIRRAIIHFHSFVTNNNEEIIQYVALNGTILKMVEVAIGRKMHSVSDKLCEIIAVVLKQHVFG
jgi:hypothetical protein